MPKVYNKRNKDAPADAVYVGRPSAFGNPFSIGKTNQRADVVRKYGEWIRTNPELVGRARAELRGKDLVCWCAPEACHADILVEIANA